MGGALGFGGGKEEQESEAGTMLQELMGGFAAETAPVRQELLSQFMTVLTSGGVGGQYSPGGAAPTSTTTAPTTPVSTRGRGSFGAPTTISTGNPLVQAALDNKNAPAVSGVGVEGADIGGGGTMFIPIVNRALEASLRAGSGTTRQTEEELARQELTGTPFGADILARTKQQGALVSSQIPTNFAAQIFNMIPNFLLGQGQTIASGLGAAVPGNVQNKGTQAGAGLSAGKGSGGFSGGGWTNPQGGIGRS